MKGFIAIMLLYIQAVASVPPNRRFRWKTNSDGLLITSPTSEKLSNVAEVQETSLPDMSVNITQKNVTILRVLMHEENPPKEPKEFKLRTYSKRQILGIDERGILIVKKSRKTTTAFMVVQFRTWNGKDEFVLCAIRGKRRYIASLDGSTNGIQLHCKETDFRKKNQDCKDKIEKMRSSKVTPYLFSFGERNAK